MVMKKPEIEVVRNAVSEMYKVNGELKDVDDIKEVHEEMIDALIKLHRYVKDNQPNYLLSSKYISLNEIEQALKKAGVEL